MEPARGSALRVLLGTATAFALIAAACSADGASDTADRENAGDTTDTVGTAEPPGGAEPTDAVTTTQPTTPTTLPGAEETSTTVETTEPLRPASISVTVEAGTSVTETVGVDGGTVSVTSADGTQFTLVVPEGALFDDVSVTMTPLEDAAGGAIGDSQIAGVRLEPDGLQFLGVALLEIVGDAVPPGAVGFRADGDGDGFHLVPTGVSDAGTPPIPVVPAEASDPGVASVPVAHFSVHGIGERQLAELASEHRPDGPAAQASQLLAVLATIGSDDVDETRRRVQLLAPIFVAWIDTVADRLGQAPDLDGLEAATVDLRDIGSAAWTVLHLTFLLDLVDEREQIVERLGLMYQRWNELVSAAVAQLSSFCAGGQIEAGFDIARWWTIGVYLTDFNGQPFSPIPATGSPLDDWVDLAADCFTFDARWNADVVNQGAGVTTPFAASVSAILPDRTTIDAAAWVEALVREGRDTVSAPSALSVTDGPFGPCDGVAGGAGLELQIETDTPNLGDVGGTTITGMTGIVGLTVPIAVVCPLLAGVPAPVADVFFVDPLAIASASWSAELAGYSTAYRFTLERGSYPDGSIARFDDQAELGGSPSTFTVLQEFTLKRAVG